MESNIKYDVFISYRRNGGSERAELLRLFLEKYGYDHNRIFMDTHSVESCNFKQKIKEAIFLSNDFILIITKGCFDYIKEEDYWIYEIKEALSLGKRIIPIFFDGIESFDSNKLPVDLVSLSEINGIIYHPQYADAFYIKLLSFINPTIPSIEKKRRDKKHILLACISIIIVSCILIVLYANQRCTRDVNSNLQEKVILQENDSIRNNNIKTVGTPSVCNVGEDWVVFDFKNNGQSLEKRFNNHDFMEIVHHLVTKGIVNGDITSFSKTRPSSPVAIEHRNEILCLSYSGGQSETIVYTTFQQLLRDFLRENYQYEDKNKVKM